MTDPPIDDTEARSSPGAGSKTLPARTAPNTAHLSTTTPETCLPTRHSPTHRRAERWATPRATRRFA
eukprot:scaffold1139_cov136-Isochrysis_galbana.AAC.2